MPIQSQEHLRLALALAHRFCRSLALCQADRDDAQQEACLALVMAGRTFDGSRPDANWPVYCTRRIRGTLLRWLHRRPLVHPPDNQTDAALPGVTRLSAADAERVPARECLNRGVFLDELWLALERLPARQRDLLAARFGLDGLGKRTLEELGNTEGVTKEAMRVREKKALGRLRELTTSNREATRPCH